MTCHSNLTHSRNFCLRFPTRYCASDLNRTSWKRGAAYHRPHSWKTKSRLTCSSAKKNVRTQRRAGVLILPTRAVSTTVNQSTARKTSLLGFATAKTIRQPSTSTRRGPDGRSRARSSRWPRERRRTESTRTVKRAATLIQGVRAAHNRS